MKLTGEKRLGRPFKFKVEDQEESEEEENTAKLSHIIQVPVSHKEKRHRTQPSFPAIESKLAKQMMAS